MPVILRWFLRLGPTNPISVRLIQNGSRRTRHLYIRSGYLAVLVLVLLWSLLAGAGSGTLSYGELAAAGAASFTLVAYLQIALICILAPVFMAGAIAQEASPRTWEVLLTTPLSATQIVLGNLIGRLFFVLALLVASLPLFALTQYFGGVPGRSIFASYGIAASAAFLVGAIAIALSVSRLAGRRAVFGFYIAVVGYVAITAGIDYWLRSTGGGAGPRGDGVTIFTAINPFLALHALLSPSVYPRAEPGPGAGGLARWMLERPVAAWCTISIVLGMVLVGLSTLTVRTGGLAALLAGESATRARRLFPLGRPEHRPPRAVWHNPVAWREASARNATPWRIFARWSFVGAGALFGVALIWLYHTERLTPHSFQIALLATVWGELAAAVLVAMNMAATAVSREREDGTLDLLLTTPLTPGQYLSGKLRGLVAYVLPLIAVPIGTLGLAGIYALAGGLGRDDAAMVSRTVSGLAAPVSVPVVLPEAGVVAALAIVPFIAVCVVVGLYWSLQSKSTLASTAKTVALIGIVFAPLGLCAWQAGLDVPYAGPVIASLSPAWVFQAAVDPAYAASGTLGAAGPELMAVRLTLLLGAASAAVVYLIVVYSIHANMVRTFDMTVRRLAGTA